MSEEIEKDDWDLDEPVYWRGLYWAATAFGVEGTPDERWCYYKLATTEVAMGHYSDPLRSYYIEHMKEKTAPFIREFATAAYIALKRNGAPVTDAVLSHIAAHALPEIRGLHHDLGSDAGNDDFKPPRSGPGRGWIREATALAIEQMKLGMQRRNESRGFSGGNSTP
jgi:hypothetical protein